MMNRGLHARSIARSLMPAPAPPRAVQVPSRQRVLDTIRIAEIILPTVPVPTIADVRAAVEAHFDLFPQDLSSSRRSASVALPRQLVMFLAREMTLRSLPEIGRHLGGRDHSTIIHGCKRVAERLKHDAALRAIVEMLRADIAERAVGHAQGRS